MKPDQFVIPPGCLYLAGHSLGPAPKAAAAALERTLHADWGARGVRAWNDADWITLAERVGAQIAAILRVKPDEVIVADSVSVNLFKLIVAACAAQPDRSEILVEADDFPTDAYVAESAAKALGKHVVLAPRQGLGAKATRQTAVVVTSHVHYRSAHRQHMAAMNSQAATVGAPVIWDLSHSTGAVDVDLKAESAHLAVGCGYKYLSGGPGAPGYLYISQAMQRLLRNPIAGWMGCADPFAFAQRYTAKPGAAAFAAGTPPILSLAALEAGVALAASVDPAALEAQAAAASQAFIAALSPKEQQGGLTRASPYSADERGAHVAYRHPNAYAIVQALAERNVIADFRAPDVMRFAFAPLYISTDQARAAAAALVQVLDSGAYKDKRFSQSSVVT